MRITKAHADFLTLVNAELTNIGCHHPVEGAAELRFTKMAPGDAAWTALIISTARSTTVADRSALFQKWAWAGETKHNLAFGLGILHACYQM